MRLRVRLVVNLGAVFSLAVVNQLVARGMSLSNVIEAIAVTATRFAQPASGVGARGPIGRWCDGVAVIRDQRLTFAEFWRFQNASAVGGDGPVWVVLGDSTALGLGACHPLHGYVGQTRARLAEATGRDWRVVNLGVSGAQTAQVLRDQLPRLARLPVKPALVTCGVGANDILHTPPSRLRAALGTLISELPHGAAVLDLPVPSGSFGLADGLGRYVARVNRVIHTAARARGLPVAPVSLRFRAPWRDKFGPDNFHPSALGYRDWTAALLDTV